MKWFAGLRALVFLRRSVRALESIAHSIEYFVEMDKQRTEHELGTRWRRGAKVSTEIGTLDLVAANKRWLAEQEADMIEPEEY
jgi:hypothetical protein